jgi:glucose-6-phosphate isomerase
MNSPLFVDTQFSLISDADWSTLYALSQEKSFEKRRSALYAGEKINVSENRSVLHTALRNIEKKAVIQNGLDIMPDVVDVWHKIELSCKEFIHVTDVIHIGIGGSDFGPRMVCDSLKNTQCSAKNHTRIHFVSNIDSADLAPILKLVNPSSTRIIVVSKTFTTSETIQNAKTVISWLKNQGIEASELPKMIYAITANPQKAIEFGVLDKNIFPFWEWVGGRFSVWSAVGLPIAIQYGFQTFMEFLAGAHAMDQHFLFSDSPSNQPLRLALALYHQQKTKQVKAQAIIPYAQSLNLFPNWLQQLEMESNGKTAGLDGKSIEVGSPVIFGIPGTNAQHSFFQMLHQGIDTIPVDFIAVHESMSDLPNHQKHHQQLWSNCLAQSEALATGHGDTSDLNHFYSGKRPNNLIVLPRLDAYHLGALMALYEHRTFCLGILYGLNSFDQPGVELGKKLAIPIEQAMSDEKADLSSLHPVTATRINWFKNTPFK